MVVPITVGRRIKARRRARQRSIDATANLTARLGITGARAYLAAEGKKVIGIPVKVVKQTRPVYSKDVSRFFGRLWR